MFSVKSKITISRQIVDDIIKSINLGELKEGDCLPGELELASRYKVSRASIREALKVLETYGVVEVSSRKLPRIINKNIQAAISIAGIHVKGNKRYFTEIQELRSVIEEGFAHKIIQMATNEDIVILENINEKLKTSQAVSDLARQDYLFHEKLVSLSYNSLVSGIYSGLSSTIEYIQEFRKNLDDGVSVAYSAHASIIEAIKEKNVNLLKEKISSHFNYSLNLFKEQNNE